MPLMKFLMIVGARAHHRLVEPGHQILGSAEVDQLLVEERVHHRQKEGG